MSPAEAILGPALAAAVRELVRDELRAGAEASPSAAAAPSRRLISVPKAAKAAGVSEETIRALIHSGRIRERLAGANLNPKRRTFLVYVDDVLAALESPPGGEDGTGSGPAPVDFGTKAAQLRARAEKRGG